MCEKLLFLGCIIAFVQICYGGPASFIQKCKSEDSKCLKESSQAAVIPFTAGIPELGVDPLDPLHYDTLDASNNELKFLLNDIVIKGVKDCQIKKMQRANSKLLAKALCSVKLDGQYEMGGKLLFLPIEGKGKIRVALNKVLLSVEADLVDKVGKDGKVHWDITTWKHSFELKDKSQIELQNLFEGNEVLGRAVKDLLNNSANDVVNEVGPPIVKALLTKVIKTVDKFFKMVPSEDLELS